MDTSFSLPIAIAVVALIPPIILINYHYRLGGLSGYIWRESPVFARILLALLFTVWLGTVFDLVAYYGLLSPRALEIFNLLMGPADADLLRVRAGVWHPPAGPIPAVALQDLTPRAVRCSCFDPPLALAGGGASRNVAHQRPRRAFSSANLRAMSPPVRRPAARPRGKARNEGHHRRA